MTDWEKPMSTPTPESGADKPEATETPRPDNWQPTSEPVRTANWQPTGEPVKPTNWQPTSEPAQGNWQPTDEPSQQV
ncbi:hypothetical protein AQ490_17575 [Wenjunlia vitaminophila]|uniref:Uncharacterized protein n=2 Tax=Wenjunlia vitaminophila TaxID=76728 RepID=A0A0T6LV58_WENVI|nr:hypothetical protein AQ490_17575 [Wenjunlia vitaminophila]